MAMSPVESPSCIFLKDKKDKKKKKRKTEKIQREEKLITGPIYSKNTFRSFSNTKHSKFESVRVYEIQ